MSQSRLCESRCEIVGAPPGGQPVSPPPGGPGRPWRGPWVPPVGRRRPPGVSCSSPPRLGRDEPVRAKRGSPWEGASGRVRRSRPFGRGYEQSPERGRHPQAPAERPGGSRRFTRPRLARSLALARASRTDWTACPGSSTRIVRGGSVAVLHVECDGPTRLCPQRGHEQWADLSRERCPRAVRDRVDVDLTRLWAREIRRARTPAAPRERKP